MNRIDYSYKIDTYLEAVNDKIESKEKWELEGQPCVYVEATYPLGHTNFVVHLPELEAFADKSIDITDYDEILSIFSDMLHTENYVENNFLSFT